MNPKPASSMQRATASGPRSMRAPSASSTSAEPERPVAERLPCLATAHPAPAAISAAVVETLNVCRPPPVPAVSITASRVASGSSTGAAKRRIVDARPTSSSTVSPFVRSAISTAAVSVSDALPAMISASTEAMSSAGKSSREASRSIALVRTGFGNEVLQQALAVRGQHRLGMELDSVGGQGAVLDGHVHADGGGGHREAARQVGIDDERVVAADDERVRQA